MDGIQAGQLDEKVERSEAGWRDGSTGSKYFFSALRRQILYLVAIPTLTVGLAFAYAIMVDPLYVASAQIRVTISPDEATSPQFSPYNTHVELIQAETVTSEVIERTGLEPLGETNSSRLRKVIADIRAWLDLGAIDSAASFDPELTLRRRVALGLAAQRISDTSLIEIQYISTSSNFSAVMANAYARTYVDQISKQVDDAVERRKQRLEKRAEEVRQLGLNATQVAQEILADSGFAVVSTEELGRRIADFRERLSVVNAEAAVLDARLARIPSLENGDAIEEAGLLTDEMAKIYSDIQDESDFLKSLQSAPDTSINTVSQLEKRIADLRSDLAQALNRYRADLTAQFFDLSARRDNILAERERVIAYGQSDVWPELVNAERTAANFESIYQSYVQSLENLTRQDRNVPVSFVSEARPPATPEFPKYKVILAFGMVIGLVLAGALALLKEWQRPLR